MENEEEPPPEDEEGSPPQEDAPAENVEEPLPEPEPEVTPESQPEPESEPEQAQEQKSESKPEQKTKAEPESKSEPTPAPPSNEKIFLLEFIVDQLNLDFCLSRYLNTLKGQICVSFKFLNNGPFKICEEDFTCKKSYVDPALNNSIKNGKSCLFSLTEDQVNEVRKSFVVNVEVNKNSSSEMDNIFVGQTHIFCTRLFAELMDVVETGEGPVFNKVVKDCYKLMDTADRDVIGYISAYIRISCFGKMIINQFQMNSEEETVDYKSNKGHYLFKYQSKPKPNYSSLCPGCEENPSPAGRSDTSGYSPCPNSSSPPCSTTRQVLPPNCHPSCLAKAAEKRKHSVEKKKPPCALGLMECNPPACCHPHVNGPKPICISPQINESSCNSPLAPCSLRATPCCVLRCDLGPKTCPCQQRTVENQTDVPESESNTSLSNGSAAKKGKK